MPEQEQESIFRIVINAPDKASLMKMVKEKNISMGGGGPRSQPDGSISLEAYVPKQILEQLQQVDVYKVEVVEDATEVGKERQKEVGVGDRFSGGQEVPRGFGVPREEKP